MKIIFSFLFFVFILSPLATFALGIGVSPSKIDTEIVLGDDATQTILIKNISGSKSEYSVYADEYSSWFVFSETKFVLDSGDVKEVYVSIKPDLIGNYATNFSIVSFYVDKKTFNAGSGIKVPVTLTVKPFTLFGLTKIQLVLVSLMFGTVLLVIYFTYYHVRPDIKAFEKSLKQKGK